ncbi:hypothetical protein HKD24_09150 [Gluconobacter sp. LMG 31484]|uniref:Uncharacterized protein n=1 Tax=Gluconobacter vitians TaxID=2728102 RepID=A0ABR9Y7J0_9PROT|nr:hypothetical protein [Gluconobacter vitians]MBF0859379.1 hypothetical protein [Gluconobacter vitians]
MSGRTDTDRLEWLGRQLSSVASRPGEDSIWKLFFVSPVEPEDFQIMTIGNFRAAIDAAMDAEERG